MGMHRALHPRTARCWEVRACLPVRMLRAQAGELVLQSPFGSALLAQHGCACGLLVLQACHQALQKLARSCRSPEAPLQLPYAVPGCQ